MLGAQQIKQAISATVHPRTEGVDVGSEVRVGRDWTDDEAVWIWVAVPDERIEEFYAEWEQLREDIRQSVYKEVGSTDVYVYVHMLAASEVGESEADEDQ